MQEKVNIGVIGAGRIGRMHAENLAFRIPNAHVPAISDIIPEAAEGCAAACNIPKAYDDYRRILDDPEVDAILICSSTDTHTRFIIEGAQAGKHIFCEKPIAVDAPGVRSVMATAKKAKDQGLTEARLDRGPYKYHGRVNAFADAAREGGLRF